VGIEEAEVGKVESFATTTEKGSAPVIYCVWVEF